MLSLLRRVVTAISIASVLGVIFKIRGKGGVPPRKGGWHEVSESELTQ